MTRNITIRNTILFFLVAVAFGCIEGSGHVNWGPPNLFGFIIAEWHIPMAVILLVIAYLTGCLQHIPAWIICEDMAYWVFSQLIWSGPELVKSSWISIGLSGMTVAGLYLPWTYVLLLGLWGIFVFIRWSYGIAKIKFDV